MRKHVHGDIDILKLVAKKCPYSPEGLWEIL